MPIFSYSCTFPNFDGKLTWANKKEQIPSKTFPMPPVEEKDHTFKATEKLSPDFLTSWFLKNPALRGGPRIFPMRRSTNKKYLQIHLRYCFFRILLTLESRSCSRGEGGWASLAPHPYISLWHLRKRKSLTSSWLEECLEIGKVCAAWL